jgi:glycosyltransferase involved in cell wall biosynthesis
MSSPDPNMRILFASSYCLLDTTSGAAISVQELLTQLAQRGFACETLTASIFDITRGISLDEMLTRHNIVNVAQREFSKNLSLVEVSYNGVVYTILKTARSQRLSLTSQEETSLLSLIERKIYDFKPDFLLTYGGLTAERSIHKLARRNGIPVVFYLANGLYKKTKTFTDVDLILVSSKFLSEFYKERLGLQSQVLRTLIMKDRYLVTRHNPRFITFINPVPHKGLTLFAQLVLQALRQLPQAKFLVVEGRWTQADIARAGVKLDRIPNVNPVRNSSGALNPAGIILKSNPAAEQRGIISNGVKVMPNQTDMKPVYEETKVLLFPSFWEEASGRTIVEAQLNGIPVMASQRGGILENLNGGGFLFDIPDRCTKNYMAIPSPEEVQPWIDQLRVLLENQEVYAEAQRRAIQAAQDFRPEKIVQRAIDLFNELLHK